MSRRSVALAGLLLTTGVGAVLFVGLFPANVKMAADTWSPRHERLPVQVPLVSWAVSVAREGRR